MEYPPFSLYGAYTPIHEVTPKVVAIAVRTVMSMFRILFQSCLFSIVSLVFSWLMFYGTQMTLM